MPAAAVTTRPPRPVATRHRVVRGALLAAVPLTLATLLALLLVTGQLAPQLLADAGPVVRWGAPAVRGVMDLSLALTLGLLIMLTFVVPRTSPAWQRGSTIAAVAASTWAVSAIGWLVLAGAETIGLSPGSPDFGGQLAFFLTEVEFGQLLTAAAVLAMIAATLPAVGLRTPTAAAWALALTVIAVVPVALTGHSAGSAGHRTAVSSWWLHILGVGGWVGGIAALALLGGLLGKDLPAVARRYSSLAGWAFVLVVVSGVANAWIRLPGLGALSSTYGLLVLGKTAAALLLGAAGWWHRRRTLGLLDAAVRGDAAAARPFWRLVAGEVVVMAVTIGLAVTLSRSPTPQSTAPEPEVLAATGEVVPPLPLTFARAFTVTNWDILWIVVVAALLISYLRWVARLRARGDRWSPGRTAAWVMGCVVLFWATNIGPTAYAEVLFSAHMLAHMVLTMAVPPLLVIGAPVTLALRALPRRRDATRGLREWLLVLVHSRWAGFVSSAPVAAVLFAGSIVVFYYTDLFGLALRTHVGHELMQLHFLATGYLYANALIGVDPGVKRPVYPVRLLILLGTMAFHSFFGVALLSGEALLQASWFSSLGIGVDALEDQRTGGGIAWGIGEFPTVIMAIIMAWQWSKADEREARRTDRAADRDDDAQLHAYNAMLGRIGEQVERDRVDAASRVDGAAGVDGAGGAAGAGGAGGRSTPGRR